MNPMSLSGGQKSILREGLCDYVGLWELAKHAVKSSRSSELGHVQRMVLVEVGPLVLNGLVEVGRLAPRPVGFEPWPGPPAEVLDRLVAEWRAFGAMPNIGDVCYFRNTRAGVDIARKL